MGGSPVIVRAGGPAEAGKNDKSFHEFAGAEEEDIWEGEEREVNVTAFSCFRIAVIARLYRAIQGKALDPPVKPEDDIIVFDFYALRSWRRVINESPKTD